MASCRSFASSQRVEADEPVEDLHARADHRRPRRAKASIRRRRAPPAPGRASPDRRPEQVSWTTPIEVELEHTGGDQIAQVGDVELVEEGNVAHRGADEGPEAQRVVRLRQTDPLAPAGLETHEVVARAEQHAAEVGAEEHEAALTGHARAWSRSSSTSPSCSALIQLSRRGCEKSMGTISVPRRAAGGGRAVEHLDGLQVIVEGEAQRGAEVGTGAERCRHSAGSGRRRCVPSAQGMVEAVGTGVERNEDVVVPEELPPVVEQEHPAQAPVAAEEARDTAPDAEALLREGDEPVAPRPRRCRRG